MTSIKHVPASSPRRRRIGDVLVGLGVLSPEELDHALEVQSAVPPGTRRRRLGSVVIELGLASENEVARALADAMGLDLVDLTCVLVVPEEARVLPRSVAERHGVLVLGQVGPLLKVAVTDPTDVVALDDVRMYTRASHLLVVVATPSQVQEQLGRAWSLTEDGDGLGVLFAHVPDDEQPDEVSQAVQSAPVVRMVDVVLADAVRARASDVHVEPQDGDLRVRYRVDGVLRDVMTLPRHVSAAIVSRIKIVAGLDIAERRRPQDGRTKLLVDGRSVEARVSSLPTVHGEKLVLRLLPGAEKVPRLSDTGMSPGQLELLRSTLLESQGLVLMTGPTGSGKTSTLYAGILELSTRDRNVVTLEDPVEVQIAGITQVQVNDRAGMTFARGLRSVLRQDPDVILVGEVRDPETAELALNASLTGHLVLTTLHTNSTISAITRLVEMGVEPFLIASSLSLVVAQRLIRRPCDACAVPYTPAASTLASLGVAPADLADATPRRGEGCPECGGTGYRGRTGVFEVLHVTAALRQVMLTSPTESAITAAVRQSGLTTLRISSLRAAAEGTTTYEEVLRVTRIDSAGAARCSTCARTLEADMAFCPWDGSPVDRGGCPGCERRPDPAWHICPWCRTALTPGAAIPVQRHVTDLPAPARPSP